MRMKTIVLGLGPAAVHTRAQMGEGAKGAEVPPLSDAIYIKKKNTHRVPKIEFIFLKNSKNLHLLIAPPQTPVSDVHLSLAPFAKSSCAPGRALRTRPSPLWTLDTRLLHSSHSYTALHN